MLYQMIRWCSNRFLFCCETLAPRAMGMFQMNMKIIPAGQSHKDMKTV